MITGISIVAVPVDDIDEALRFYCEVLRMEKRKDLSRSEGGALHRGRTSRIVGRALPPTYTRDDQEPGKAAIGKYSRVVLRVVDVRKATRN